MIDVEREHILTLREAGGMPPFLRKGGRPASYPAMLRYSKNGFRGHRLETLRMPDGLRTSKEAVLRFVESINGSECAPATARAVRIADERAAKELETLLK